jgi:hypothetical protein
MRRRERPHKSSEISVAMWSNVQRSRLTIAGLHRTPGSGRAWRGGRNRRWGINPEVAADGTLRLIDYLGRKGFNGFGKLLDA